MADETKNAPAPSSPSISRDLDAVVGNAEPLPLTPHQRRIGLIHFLPLCVSLFMVGWSDGASGPLIPRLRQEYNVGFIVVSLIFVLNTVGCIVGAVSNVYLTQKLGFGKVIVLGATLQTISFAIQSPGPPFPAFVFSFFLGGIGLSLQDSHVNGFVAALKDDSAATKMGIIHALYGTGALVSPVLSTHFSHAARWSFHYLVSTGLGLLSIALLIAVFRFKTQEQCLAESGQPPEAKNENSESHYRQILRLNKVYLIALYLFVYVGAEVTLGSWSVTYIIEERGGGRGSGYISTGFFGGLTLGRVALLPVNKWIGESRVVYIYITLSLALQLVVWLVPSLIGGGVCISLIGFFLGPLFPITMNYAGRVLPPWLLTGSIGLMTGVAASGAAALPFATGAIAQRAGIKALQPMVVGMIAVMFVIWVIVERTASYTPALKSDEVDEKEKEESNVQV